MKKFIAYNVTPNEKGELHQIIIREGAALKPVEPKAYSTNGNIDAVARYIKHESNRTSTQQAVVMVNRQNMSIMLLTEENNPLATTVTGKLEINPDLLKFHINTEEEFSRSELLKLIKMNRVYFPDVDSHAKLISQLKAMEAKIEATIREENNERGKKENTNIIDAKVDIEVDFMLAMPPYKGAPNEKFRVSICYEASSTQVVYWLESIELKQLLDETREKLINEQLEQIKGYLIIEG